MKQRSAEGLLRQLRAMKLRHKTESQYQLWQEGSHPEQIQNEAVMWQNLEYVHNNPVARGTSAIRSIGATPAPGTTREGRG